jgi:ankyrin repeat-rich membrane spanning protein
MQGNAFIDPRDIHNSDDDTDYLGESDSDEDDGYEHHSEKSLIYIACESGDEDAVDRLLRTGGVDVEKRYVGFTSLLIAVERGQTKIVERLLAHGVNLSAVGNMGNSSIMIAARKGYTSMMKALLEHDPATTKKMINMTNKQNITPLDFAVGNDRVEIARMLIKHGADVNKEDSQGRTILFDMTNCKNGVAFVKLILEHDINIHHEDKHGNTAMRTAFFHENLEIIKLLMDAGLTLDMCNKKGVSLAHCVAKWGMYSMAKFLVSNNAACLDSKSMSGKTPCSTAELYGNYGVKMIFKSKITKDRSDAKRAKH